MTSQEFIQRIMIFGYTVDMQLWNIIHNIIHELEHLETNKKGKW